MLHMSGATRNPVKPPEGITGVIFCASDRRADLSSLVKTCTETPISRQWPELAPFFQTAGYSSRNIFDCRSLSANSHVYVSVTIERCFARSTTGSGANLLIHGSQLIHVHRGWLFRLPFLPGSLVAFLLLEFSLQVGPTLV